MKHTHLAVGVPGDAGRIGLLVEQLFRADIIDHQHIVLIHHRQLSATAHMYMYILLYCTSIAHVYMCMCMCMGWEEELGYCNIVVGCRLTWH